MRCTCDVRRWVSLVLGAVAKAGLELLSLGKGFVAKVCPSRLKCFFLHWSRQQLELLELPESRRRGRRPRLDPSKLDPHRLTGDENVSVINRLTGKKVSSSGPCVGTRSIWREMGNVCADHGKQGTSSEAPCRVAGEKPHVRRGSQVVPARQGKGNYHLCIARVCNVTLFCFYRGGCSIRGKVRKLKTKCLSSPLQGANVYVPVAGVLPGRGVT